MAAADHSYDLDEKFDFGSAFKKNIFLIGGIGLVFLIIGIIQVMSGGGHDEHALLMEGMEGTAMAGGGEHHGSPSWLKRIFANLWINNVYFTGIAIAGVFFFAVQYVAKAGWSVPFLRIMNSFGRFLPVAFVLMIGVFFAASHDLFHWTHSDLYVEGGEHYDAIIAGKQPFFFMPGSESTGFPTFYVIRMVLFLAVWTLFANAFAKNSAAEDVEGGTKRYWKLVKMSAGFIVFFGISSSMSAWDWIMSIDTHWFSTMFGWYVFASWFVAALAGITLVAVLLKEAGFLNVVNENHLHDMGKFVFAFSIFWTYIWFSQFLLIYYANIPEETVYFIERLQSDQYSKFIFINLFMNFIFPFLALMTRDAKRKMAILKIVCPVVMVGHWLDFYLMVTPGTLREAGGFGFLEIGMAMVYLAVFAFLVFQGLSKNALVPKNHPMIEESLHHHT